MPKSADVVFINRENTKSNGFDFTKGKRKLFLQGDCDDIIGRIIKDAGWIDEFSELVSNL